MKDNFIFIIGECTNCKYSSLMKREIYKKSYCTKCNGLLKIIASEVKNK